MANSKTPKTKVYSGILTRFLVYKDYRGRKLIGHGYRVMYEPKEHTLVSNMTLLDNNNQELPDGSYFLGDLTDDELVVITETKQ